MSADCFTDRLRERMPAHGVWREIGATPTVSRPANDVLWDEMRARLRAYEELRRSTRQESGLRAAFGAVTSAAGAGSAIAIGVGVTIFGLAVARLIR